MLLFFVRHGERADKTLNMSLFSNLINCDPYLTPNGKQQAYDVGKKVIQIIEADK